MKQYTYDQNQCVALSEVTGEIPHGARFKYISTPQEENQEYILAQVKEYQYCLINLTDGNRWDDIVEEVHPQRSRLGAWIRRDMLDKIAVSPFKDTYFVLCIPDGLTLEQYTRSNTI